MRFNPVTQLSPPFNSHLKRRWLERKEKELKRVQLMTKKEMHWTVRHEMCGNETSVAMGTFE